MPAALRRSTLLDVPTRLWHRMTAIGRRGRTDAAPALASPVQLDVDVNGRIGPPEPADGTAMTANEPDDGDASADRLGETLERTLEEVHHIAGRFAEHGARTRHFVEHFDELPAHVALLPGIGRENTRLLGLLRDQAERTATGVESFGGSLEAERTRAERLSERQTELLGDVQSALDETTITARGIVREASETLASMSTAADRLSATTNRLADALQKASQSAGSREQRMARALDRTHRWTVASVCVCGAISTLALIGVGLALFS